ncbi:TetR/AcrR family transcriptional regulator [Nonlabens ponticola]|uniref:TetR/AcrR family transcriptional regulator n=1 Tax=Nonlabens ponticola TaxID=2496866 RepID=A0A3S9MV78_9FLAO|nr:TetR/AcrR family transcriptional regulator [Nonlabens ponticola]AZQ43085.1 TetR/AcrR family transcriptional regulator [Nonlabens ponticola]
MPRVETFNREQVLEAAMQTFWAHGYQATSMQQLVDATGLNRSSLYNSFGDKMDLYKASLKHYMNGTQQQFTAAIEQAAHPLEAIRNIFYMFLPEIQTDSRGCMSMSCKSELNADVSIKAFLENTQEQSLLMFEKLVRDGQESGVINKDKSSREYAWHVFNAFQGYRMTGILVKDINVLKGIIDLNLSVLE